MVSILQLEVKKQDDVLLLRQLAKEIAALAGLANKDESRFNTALLNVARHALRYTAGGMIEFAVLETEISGQCLSATLSLAGPGIEALEAALNGDNGSDTITINDTDIHLADLVDSFSMYRQSRGGITIRLIIALPANGPKADASLVREWLNTIYEKEPASAASILQQKNQDLMVSLLSVKSLRLSLDDSFTQVGKLNKELEDTNIGVLALYREIDDKSIKLAERNEQLQSSQKILEQLSLQMRESAKVKGQFLDYMSHEIRTPLNAIIGLGDILSRSSLNTEQSGWIDLLRRSGHALLTIINDILDFSKLEAGKLLIEAIEFDPALTIECSVELLNCQAKEKNLSLLTFIDPLIPRLLYGDAGRLRQILINLINNAIKFTEGGKIEVHATLQNIDEKSVTVRFSISDTGIGIPKELRHTLFQPFIQIPGAESDTHVGTGLGLSICKNLAEQMGGEIGTEDTKGKGATFWFVLPFKLVDTNKQSINRGSPATATPMRSSSSLKGHILLAEDNPVNQVVTTIQLKELGLTVDVAEDGRRVLEAISKTHYALIFMDCQMPVMDGYEATRKIREMETISMQHLPIVAMTANAVFGSKEKCLAAGMDDYISKPLSIEDLRSVLERGLLGQRIAEVKAKEHQEIMLDTTSSTNYNLRPQEELVDIQYMQKRFEPAQLSAIFNSFVAETEIALERIIDAVEAKSVQDLKAHAHCLKGSSATVHATIIARTASKLEETADQLDWQAAKNFHHTLKESFLELRNFLEEGGITDSVNVYYK